MLGTQLFFRHRHDTADKSRSEISPLWKASFCRSCLMDFGSIRYQEVSAMVRLLVDPNQVQSSSEFGVILSPVALRRLQSSWQFLFRKVILELMPADALAAHFHDVIGRPTKELYSVAGLLLIKEFMNW